MIILSFLSGALTTTLVNLSPQSVAIEFTCSRNQVNTMVAPWTNYNASCALPFTLHVKTTDGSVRTDKVNSSVHLLDSSPVAFQGNFDYKGYSTSIYYSRSILDQSNQEVRIVLINGNSDQKQPDSISEVHVQVTQNGRLEPLSDQTRLSLSSSFDQIQVIQLSKGEFLMAGAFSNSSGKYLFTSKSGDFGKTWSRPLFMGNNLTCFHGPLSKVESGRIFLLAIDQLAGNSTLLLYSDNNATTWRTTNFSKSQKLQSFLYSAIVNLDNNTLLMYARFLNLRFNQYSISPDNGITWSVWQPSLDQSLSFDLRRVSGQLLKFAEDKGTIQVQRLLSKSTPAKFQNLLTINFDYDNCLAYLFSDFYTLQGNVSQLAAICVASSDDVYYFNSFAVLNDFRFQGPHQ